jgi:hypothetical protein
VTKLWAIFVRFVPLPEGGLKGWLMIWEVELTYLVLASRMKKNNATTYIKMVTDKIKPEQ